MMVKIIDDRGSTMAMVEAARVFITGYNFAELYAHQVAMIYGDGLVDLGEYWTVTEPSTGARFALGPTIDDAVRNMHRWMKARKMSAAAWRRHLGYIEQDLARLRRTS